MGACALIRYALDCDRMILTVLWSWRYPICSTHYRLESQYRRSCVIMLQTERVGFKLDLPSHGLERHHQSGFQTCNWHWKSQILFYLFLSPAVSRVAFFTFTRPFVAAVYFCSLRLSFFSLKTQAVLIQESCSSSHTLLMVPLRPYKYSQLLMSLKASQTDDLQVSSRPSQLQVDATSGNCCLMVMMSLFYFVDIVANFSWYQQYWHLLDLISSQLRVSPFLIVIYFFLCHCPLSPLGLI